MMNESDHLSRSESSSELPQTLRDQIDAICDFDPFASLNNSINKKSNCFIDQTTNPALYTDEQLQIKLMQKLGIFGDQKLTEIVEETSEMEMSELNITKQAQNWVYLKSIDSEFKLDNQRNEKMNYKEQAKNGYQSERNNNQYDNKQTGNSYKQQESYSEKTNNNRPDISIDVNCMKNFTIDHKLQNINRIEIVSNNNYYININGKSVSHELIKEVSFKKKPESKTLTKKDKESNITKTKMKNIIDNSTRFSNSARSIKQMIQNVSEKRKSIINSNTKSQNNNKSSVDQVNIFLNKSIANSEIGTLQQLNSDYNNNVEQNIPKNKRGSDFIDLYLKSNNQNNKTPNIYKRRYTDVETQQKAFASIESIRKKEPKTNISLNRADCQGDNLRSTAFREFFGNEDKLKPPFNIKKVNVYHKSNDKEKRSSMNTTSDNRFSSHSMQKASDLSSLKLDKKSIKAVLSSHTDPFNKRALNLGSNFNKKKNREYTSKLDIGHCRNNTMSKIKKQITEKDKDVVHVISRFNVDNTTSHIPSKFATLIPTQCEKIFSTNSRSDNSDGQLEALNPFDYRHNFNNMISRGKTISGSSYDDSSDNNDNNFIDYGDLGFIKPLGVNSITQRQSDHIIYAKNSHLRSVQFHSSMRNTVFNEPTSLNFKSIQLKGLGHTINDAKLKKKSQFEKSTTDFVEKNISSIDKTKNCNNDLQKVHQINQKFFEKVKMMSKI